MPSQNAHTMTSHPTCSIQFKIPNEDTNYDGFIGILVGASIKGQWWLALSLVYIYIYIYIYLDLNLFFKEFLLVFFFFFLVWKFKLEWI